MAKQFDYLGAKEAGYTDAEIQSFLQEKNPHFDYEGALQAGYSPEEVNEFLSQGKPETTAGKVAKKGGRLVGQYALGAAQLSAPGFAYDVAVAPLASEEAQLAAYRGNVGEDIERLLEQKQTGVWDEQDEELLNHLMGQIESPEKAKEFVETTDISLRGLAEKATGEDLHPEGVLEKAAHWAGIVRDPRKLGDLRKIGIKNPKELLKAALPTAKEIRRGLGTGVALEYAEQGGFGPIGQLAIMAGADLISGEGIELLKDSKKLIGKVNAAFKTKEQLELQKEIINNAREAGIQLDLGTITQNNLVKGIQSQLAQSKLSGKSLDNFRKQLTQEIIQEYKQVAETLGEVKYATRFEAAAEGQEYLKRLRDADREVYRELYKEAEEAIEIPATAIEGDVFVYPEKIAKTMETIEKKLTPGALKSAEQKAVLEAIEKIKPDVISQETGAPKLVDVRQLINTKRALQDIIDYEVQGGAKQLLKGVVKSIDDALLQYGKESNPQFLKSFKEAERRFADHAKTFRNKNINSILLAQNPEVLINKMNSVQGIKEVRKAFGNTAEGKEAFNALARNKVEEMVGKKMVDNISQQVKLGTFSNILKNPKDRQILQELLGKEGFKRLERLTKTTGKLAESAQKFYNASQSGVSLADSALIGKFMMDLGNAFYGNAWPLAQSVSTWAAVRGVAKVITDPEALKFVEEAILASEKNDLPKMIEITNKLVPILQRAYVTMEGEEE